MAVHFIVGAIVNIGTERRFEILELLGEGAFGAVFKCIDRCDDIEVAVKVETQEDTLKPEYDFYALLNGCAGTPTCYGGNFVNAPFFLSMTVEGDSWSDVRAKCPNRIIPSKRLLSISYHAIRAFKLIHSVGVLHNDIRCANMVMSRTPGKLPVLLLDFGLSRRVQIQGDRRVYSTVPAARRSGFSSVRVAQGHAPQELDDLHALVYVILDMRKAWKFYFVPFADQLAAKVSLAEDPDEFVEDSEACYVPTIKSIFKQSYDGLPNYEEIMQSFYKVKNFEKDYYLRPL